MGNQHTLWVDDAAHMLHWDEQSFPCDRNIEAALPWNNHALLLSSDTDCLSLWDKSGLIRLVRVGVYPQDMAIQDEQVIVCGGTDGRLHLLSLPALETIREISVPGMPERIAWQDGVAWLLTLLPEPTVQTALLEVDLLSGCHRELARYAGLPGAVYLDRNGLWVAVSEQLLHFRLSIAAPDMVVSGFGLIRRLRPSAGGIMAIDPLEERVTLISAPPAPAVVPRPGSSADFTILTL